MAEPSRTPDVQEAHSGPVQNGRRFVGAKETVGFVLVDAAANINFLKDSQEFPDRVLNIDKGLQALFGPLLTLWDVANDLFVAAFVDKTRTRFGKFRPYLFAYPFYSIPIAIVFFTLPYIFSGAGGTFWPKIIVWLVMKMCSDLSLTIYDITRTGMIANITPDPNERTRLITKANFYSMFGEDFPKQVFNILRDIISRSAVDTFLQREQRETNMRALFLVFGVSMMILSSLLTMYFALVSKERVLAANAANEKPPSVRDTLRGVRHNRPLLMLMLSDVLDGFQLKRQSETYEKSILNFANFGVVAGIPGVLPSYLSFAFVPRLRERFSSKFLWILQSYIEAPIFILIYFFGMTKVKNAAKAARGITYRFMDLVPMLVAFSFKITAGMSFYGVQKVIPEELRNECIDYGEWKNGFRTEGVTGALKGVSKKVTEMFGRTISDSILKLAGFETGAENYNRQSESTAKTVFALTTIIPTVMGLISVFPKLFYNINKKDRERMYAELAERRALAGLEIQGIGGGEASL